MKAILLSAQARASSAGPRSTHASAEWTNPKVGLADVTTPQPQGQELLLKVEYCGLCGSDFHLSEPGANAEVLYPGLLELPVVLGHEFSATVAGYGPAVSASARGRFPVGAAVTAEEMQWCGHCNPCRAGQVNHCDHLEEIGFTRNGAHTEYICVDPRFVWPLLGLERAAGRSHALQMGAMVEPYAVSYRALFQGAHGNRWLPGSNILILGAGPIGLAAVDLALAAGASQVAVIEPIEARRALAIKMGAGHAFSPDVTADKLKETFPNGCEWVVDAAGAPELAVTAANAVLSIGGSICLLARTDEKIPLMPELLITRNARVFGSQGHSGEGTFPHVISMMENQRIHPLKMLDSVIGLADAAIRLASHNRGTGKILVCPGKENL